MYSFYFTHDDITLYLYSFGELPLYIIKSLMNIGLPNISYYALFDTIVETNLEKCTKFCFVLFRKYFDIYEHQQLFI